jgi:AcrR family transcriptional regulator
MDRRNKNSRNRIIKAATRVFAEKGYHLSTVDEIARAAGVAKGTVYYNFPSKAGMFTAAVTEGMESIMERVKGELESDLPFARHFARLVEANLSVYLEHRDLARIFFNELSSGIEDQVLQQIDAVRDRYIDFIAELLQRGQQLGYIRPIDPRLAAVGIVSLLDGLCNHHLRNGRDVDQSQLTSTVSEILSSGLLARGGRDPQADPSASRA